ncbi:MAG: hypothetical protein ACKPE3_12280, partial [Sphaerospermopsis kisseleviana]
MGIGNWVIHPPSDQSPVTSHQSPVTSHLITNLRAVSRRWLSDWERTATRKKRSPNSLKLRQ